MAHELDFTTGQAAIAYVQGSETPWHGLGQTVDPTASIQDWKRAARLNWEARRAEVTYRNDLTGRIDAYAEKHVLYRSDTGKPLSVVSSDYRAVQPDDILSFFGGLAESGGFRIETVGALKAGRRIRALGRVGENARILDDEVAPCLLLATSYDGTMATVAKFTTVRVVCNNTLQASLHNAAGQTQVTIPHQATFDPARVRGDLGIALDAWEDFKHKAGLMAARKITDAEWDAWLLELFEPFSEQTRMNILQRTLVQHEVLTHAIQHTNGRIEWFPDHVPDNERESILYGMIGRGLITRDGDDWVVTAEGCDELGRTRPASAPLDAKPRTRENSKQTTVIRMLQRPEGATIRQIVEATSWKAHTVRGTFAGALKKKLGLTLVSDKAQGGERVYKIA